MEYLIIQILCSLAIALIAVWFDRKLRDKRELVSILDSLVFELAENLSIARTIKSGIDNEVELTKRGGWSPTPKPIFMDIAYSRAILSETFFDFVHKKHLNVLMKKLFECYAAFQVVNQNTRILNEAKFEVLTQPSLLPKYIEEILQKNKEVLLKVIEPAITQLLLLLAQIDSRFQDVIEPLTTSREINMTSGRNFD